jgi:diadenosine tetraphosphatase ApaH/serine/threonine PP2A family protein phosphatase
VRIALFADIHANRQAFSACLAQAREFGAERTVLLGDYVGYGADPEWTVKTIMDLVDAEIVIEWTRGELGALERRFLAELPLTREEEDRLYVHADASNPKSWRYVTDIDGAARSLVASPFHITFCGHVHRPALYTMSATGKMTAFRPIAGSAIQLLPSRRWLAVLGSVGQPRDGNPAAAFAMLDTAQAELTYCRVPYDIEAAAAGIRNMGLPPRLADRLFEGQ